MTSTSLKPDIQELQKDIVDLLEQVSKLMGRASTTLQIEEEFRIKHKIEESLETKYAAYRDQIIEETRKVKNLELRMAIAAPMSAGKSTIINAIVGQEILPSRNSAMTTIPTEIALRRELQEPVLTLSSDLLFVFQKAWNVLKNKIEELGEAGLSNQVGEYPHLQELLQVIRDSIACPIRAKNYGQSEIVKTLEMLNDIIRLCSQLAPFADPLQALTDVPCIETPFSSFQSDIPTEVLGNLVIVDTPGANEAGKNLRLINVVEEQLQKSSLVLIVLDYTMLKTVAAEAVRTDVEKVIRIRGKESLYILVNKVDQRTDKDMTPEQVQQFVASEFDFDPSSIGKRVFEISARRAFVASSFKHELKENLNVLLHQMKMARPLAQEVFGIDWEDELEDAEIETLERKAERLWKKSGFSPFLNQAISTLIIKAAPECLKAALKISQEQLEALQEDVSICDQAIAIEAGELQKQIDELEADLERLNICHLQLNDVSRIKNELHRKLSRTLENLQEKAKVSLETYWNQEEYQRADFIEKRRIEAGNFAGWIAKKIGVEIDKGKSLIECKTKFEAEEFASQAINVAKQRISGLLEITEDETQQQIEAARCKLIKKLKAETTPIIEKARQRLNEAFEIDLSLPTFSLSTDDPKISKPRVKKEHRYVSQGYATRKVKKRSFWHWVWIIPYEETERIKRPEKREDYYTVSLENLIEEINRSIELSINTINQNINTYVDEDFQDRVDLFFEDLDTYLRRYKDSLQSAQAYRKLSQDKQEQLIEELNSLTLEATSQLEKTSYYMQYTHDLLEEM